MKTYKFTNKHGVEFEIWRQRFHTVGAYGWNDAAPFGWRAKRADNGRIYGGLSPEYPGLARRAEYRTRKELIEDLQDYKK